MLRPPQNPHPWVIDSGYETRDNRGTAVHCHFELEVEAIGFLNGTDSPVLIKATYFWGLSPDIRGCKGDRM